LDRQDRICHDLWLVFRRISGRAISALPPRIAEFALGGAPWLGGCRDRVFSDFLFSQFFVQKFFHFLYVPAIPLLVPATGANGILRRFLSLSWLSYVGRATYSIYLWQEFFTGPLFARLSPLMQGLALLAMMAACLVLFEKVERPLIRYGRVMSARLQKTKSGAAFSPAET
jgi:peptidoglycan/LPS O-acetylase OafA/YrhL